MRRHRSTGWWNRTALSALGAVACLVGSERPATAQIAEVVPFVGYRFGGDFFEWLTGTAQDLDGTASLGAACDIALDHGLSLEIVYARQSASIAVPGPGIRPARVEASSEYWHVGGLQEFMGGVARPFLTGTLGLTRLVVGGDNELRFSLGAGGGIKLRATEHLGLRLDGRVLVTFMDGSFTTVICSPGRCITGLHVSTVWQADFSGGLAVAF